MSNGLSGDFFDNQQIAYEDLPRPESLDFTPLSSKLPFLACLRHSGVYLAIFAGVLAILLKANDGNAAFAAQPVAVIGLIGLAATLILTWREAKQRGFAVRVHDLVNRRGLLWKRQVVVPLARVQHVETHQGPLERLFSLRTLLIYTAGGSGADLKIEGLDETDALRLYSWLTRSQDATENETPKAAIDTVTSNASTMAPAAPEPAQKPGAEHAAAVASSPADPDKADEGPHDPGSPMNVPSEPGSANG